MHPTETIKRSRKKHNVIFVWVRFALPLLACLLLFWPLLVKGHVLAFRDTLHFYYPLWKYLDARDYADWLLPQFNYYDYAGVPIVGEPTSMIFYPPRLLLRLPWLSVEQCIGLFLSFHLCLCWYASYYVTRAAFGRSALAASLVASGYAFGGVTYFNIYNPPYLVSSCWLPLALGATGVLVSERHRCVAKHHARWGVLLAISLTAMILGGDVQTPYNLAILCAMSVSAWIFTTLFNPSSRSVFKSSLKNIAQVAAAFVFAGLLSAIQLLPTYCWLRIDEGSSQHSRAIGSEYTLHIWDVATWLSPMSLGSYTQTHTRWIAALDNVTMWTPSLHMAVAILASIVVSWGLIRYRRTRWLVAISVISVWAALGDGWGLYSALARLLPFYEFRFPFKWYSIAAFALCVIGGYGFDLATQKANQLRNFRIALGTIGILNLVIAIVVVVAPRYFDQASLTVPSDRLCGAFDLRACCQQILIASTVTACVGFVLAWLLRIDIRDRWERHAVEWLTFGQLAAIAWLMTTTVPSSVLEQSVPGQSVWQTSNVAIPVYWDIQTPEHESAEKEFAAQTQGPMQVAAFQRRWLVGKMHLLTPGRSLFAQLSLTPSFYSSGPRSEWLQPAFLPATEVSKIDLLNDAITIKRENSNILTEIKLPILNDGGWSSAEPKVEIVGPENHLLMVRLPVGVKDAKLTYCAPGLRVGACISFLALIVFVLLICKRYV